MKIFLIKSFINNQRSDQYEYFPHDSASGLHRSSSFVDKTLAKCSHLWIVPEKTGHWRIESLAQLFWPLAAYVRVIYAGTGTMIERCQPGIGTQLPGAVIAQS